MSPYEKLTGRKPKLIHVRVFGCTAFVYEEAPRSKIHARVSPSIFLECNDYRVYIVQPLTDMKIINSVHVNFSEPSFLGLESTS